MNLDETKPCCSVNVLLLNDKRSIGCKNSKYRDLAPFIKKMPEELFQARDELERLPVESLNHLFYLKFMGVRLTIFGLFKSNNIDIKTQYPKIYFALCVPDDI